MSEPIELEQVFAAAGGKTALAAQIGIDRTTVYSWKQVPARRVFAVAAVTGIPAERLRPDMFEPPAAGAAS